MSEESSREISKIKELENRFEELRCSLFLLIIITIVLTSSIIVLLAHQLPFPEFLSWGTFFIIPLVFLILATICTAAASGKYTEKERSSLGLEPFQD